MHLMTLLKPQTALLARELGHYKSSFYTDALSRSANKSWIFLRAILLRNLLFTPASTQKETPKIEMLYNAASFAVRVWVLWKVDVHKHGDFHSGYPKAFPVVSVVD